MILIVGLPLILYIHAGGAGIRIFLILAVEKPDISAVKTRTAAPVKKTQPLPKQQLCFERCKPFADSIFGKLGYTVNIELIHYLPTMCLDGLGTDVQLQSNLLR